MTSTSISTETQTFSYIEHMLVELRQMSEKQDAPVLAYLIEMAIIETNAIISSKKETPIQSNGQVDGYKQLLSS